MQGSHRDPLLHDQSYRTHLRQLFAEYLPTAQVYDPLADHANSLEYDDQQGRQVFFHHVDMCTDSDLVLAFLPAASMGTAIEMWAAHQAGRVVVSVTPLEHNWVVRFLSDHVYPSLESFEQALVDGSFARRAADLVAQKQLARANAPDATSY
jgi:hypothetical protein